MGVTTHSNNLVQKHRGNAKTMIELGSQNTYFDAQPAGVAKEYYASKGFEHHSIDTNGEYGSEVADLSTVLDLPQADIVTDFGTSEHVSNFYNCWLNKHNGCKVGGLIISENPKVGNWPDHGYHYVTQEFYKELAKVAGYEILELGEHAAMGNVTDGWNVYCVLKKTSEDFPTLDAFTHLPYESSIKLMQDILKTDAEIQLEQIEAAEGLVAGSLTNDPKVVYSATYNIELTPEGKQLRDEANALDAKETATPQEIEAFKAKASQTKIATITEKPKGKRGRPVKSKTDTKAKK